MSICIEQKGTRCMKDWLVARHQANLLKMAIKGKRAKRNDDLHVIYSFVGLSCLFQESIPVCVNVKSEVVVASVLGLQLIRRHVVLEVDPFVVDALCIILCLFVLIVHEFDLSLCDRVHERRDQLESGEEEPWSL